MSCRRSCSPWHTLAVALAAVLAATSAHAALLSYTLPQLIEKSRHVVTGEVTEVRCYRAPFHDLGEVTFTDVTIRVDGVLKGSAVKQVTVQVLGGEIGTAVERCPDSPRFTKGEKVLVFLREYHGALWTTGWLQGKYTLSDDGSTVKGVQTLPISRDTPLESLKAEVKLREGSSVSPSGGRTLDEGGAR